MWHSTSSNPDVLPKAYEAEIMNKIKESERVINFANDTTLTAKKKRCEAYNAVVILKNMIEPLQELKNRLSESIR